MPTPVTVFRWDDVGAPQLNTGKPSEIINVLKKCLVEGYGSKVALDWSIAFEDSFTQKIVFQNKVAAGGSGGMVRFRSNTGADANFSVMRFVAAKSFSNIDNPFQAGFEQAFRQEQANQKGWVIIGTPKSFYFMICLLPSLTPNGSKMSSSVNYNSNIFVGDFESFIPSDAGKFISTNGSSSDNVSVGWPDTMDFDSAGSSSAAIKIMRADGGAFSMSHRLVHPFGQSTNAENGELLPKILVPICLSITSQGLSSNLNDTNGGKINGSLLFPFYRGKLPGLFQGDFAGYSNVNWPVIKTIDSRQMWLVKNAHVYGCSVWIDLESWE